MVKEFVRGDADSLRARHANPVVAAENAVMDNRLPLSVLFSLLVVAVLPVAIGLYWRGHMDLGAVLSHLGS
jgi:hypothetical protein